MTAIFCAACLAAIGVGGCYYKEAVLPQRMADKGYCQEAALASREASGRTDHYAVGVWRPCAERAQKPKVE